MVVVILGRRILDEIPGFFLERQEGRAVITVAPLFKEGIKPRYIYI